MTNNRKFSGSGLLRNLFKKRESIQEHFNHIDTEHVQNTLLDYYTLFAKNHPDIILVFSLDGQLISDNKSSVNEYLGYRPKQSIPFKQLVSEENYSLLTSAFLKASKGTSERIEVNVINKQGELVDIIATFVPIETPTKNIEGILLFLRDITVQKQMEIANELNTSHLEQAQQIAKIGSWEYHIPKDEIKCSKSCYEIFGFEDSDTFSMDTPLSLIHLEDYNQTKQLVRRGVKDGIGYTTEFRIYHGKTGELRHIKVKVEVEMKNNQPFKFIGVVKDVTEQKLLNMQIIETTNNYRHIFDNLNVGIWMRESINGKITFASKGMEDILQIPLATLYVEPDYWKDMVLPMYRDELFEKYKRLSKGESIEHQFRLEDGEGTTKWIYEQTVPKVNDAGEITHLFGMVTDISPEIDMQKKLEFLAKNDALTALPNYHSLHEKIDELIKKTSTKYFALLYMDLDNFNWIIDYLGYQIGDNVLKKVASRLIATLPDKSYLAKVDSDAFVFIISDYKNKEEVFQFAEKIIQTVGKQIMVEGYEFYVTASLGISFYPDNGENKLILLENAHTALYHAKQLGKNNYQIYSFDRDISSHKKYMLEQDLRKAIKNEEFEIYYQPQVNPNSEAIEGAEALIRWNHKEWGLVSPAEFIPLAEEKHLIHHIGDWVIRNVCQQLKTWKEQGYTLYPIAINISPIRLLKPDIVDIVKKELNRHQIPAKYLEIEITENSLLRNEKNVSETINALKELGIRIALDDFGTGYSSFHYLQKFNLDTLKIDQMFIRNLDSQDYSTTKEAAIVSSFLHLAKGLKMKIVAEGVEEYEQLEFLKQKQCDRIQGYIYSKPVPVDQFEQMMKVRYVKPKKQKAYIKPEKERRKYFRFAFPHHLPATMRITEVNRRKIDVGSANILVENISLGGIRFLSTLRLPVVSNIKLNFQLNIMNQCFEIDGSLVYKSEEKAGTYAYGVSFSMTEGEKDRLAEIINKMTLLRRMNNKIPDTEFIEGNPYLFLREKLL